MMTKKKTREAEGTDFEEGEAGLGDGVALDLAHARLWLLHQLQRHAAHAVGWVCMYVCMYVLMDGWMREGPLADQQRRNQPTPTTSDRQSIDAPAKQVMESKTHRSFSSMSYHWIHRPSKEP